MNILIIGGTGLISSAITRNLLEGGDSVAHFNRGKRSDAPPGVRPIIGDRNDYAAFERQMEQEESFDCVIDMIGYAPDDARSAVRAFAGRTGHFIFCSTVDVYARPSTRFPIRSDEPLGGRNDYGRDKVLCEQILEQAANRGDFPLSILRPAHTYGDGGALIHSFGGGNYFVDRLRKHKPIIVHGDGQSLWCLAHASDVGPAFVQAAGNPKSFGKSYNVAGEEWLTWDEMYHKTAQVLKAPAPNLVHIPTDVLARLKPKWGDIVQQNFQFNNIFDNAPARDELDYRYTIDFDEAARRITRHWDTKNALQNSDEQVEYDNLIAVWRHLGDAMQPGA